MTPEQFCYWLQGLLECKSDGDHLTPVETLTVRDHLATVFGKVTPPSPREVKLLTDAIRDTKRIC